MKTTTVSRGQSVPLPRRLPSSYFGAGIGRTPGTLSATLTPSPPARSCLQCTDVATGLCGGCVSPRHTASPSQSKRSTANRLTPEQLPGSPRPTHHGSGTRPTCPTEECGISHTQESLFLQRAQILLSIAPNTQEPSLPSSCSPFSEAAREVRKINSGFSYGN